NGDKNDVITVTVTPNAAGADGAAVSDSATVIDTAPTATVSLNTASPKTNDTLTATATSADADGDAVTLTYVWKVNGTTVQTTSGTSSLPVTLAPSFGCNGDKNDVITVE